MEILATIPVYTYPWFYNIFMAIAVNTIPITKVVQVWSSIEEKAKPRPTITNKTAIAIKIL